MSKKSILPSLLALSCLFSNVVNAGYSDYDENPKISNKTNVRNKAKNTNNSEIADKSNTGKNLIKGLVVTVSLALTGGLSYYLGGRGPKSELEKEKGKNDTLQSAYDLLKEEKDESDKKIKELNENVTAKVTELSTLNSKLNEANNKLTIANKKLEDNKKVIEELEKNVGDDNKGKIVVANVENEQNAGKYKQFIEIIDKIKAKYPDLEDAMNKFEGLMETKQLPAKFDKILNNEEIGEFVAKFIEMCRIIEDNQLKDKDEILGKILETVLPDDFKKFVPFIKSFIGPKIQKN